jgi:hypothetical protein
LGKTGRNEENLEKAIIWRKRIIWSRTSGLVNFIPNNASYQTKNNENKFR